MQILNSLRKAPLVLVIAFAATMMQAQTDQVELGRTSVTFSQEFGGTLIALGLSASAVSPATLQTGTGVATFPITEGAIELPTARAEINHAGGFILSNGSTQVRLENFTIDTTSTPVLTGLVVSNNSLVGRIAIFDLQLPSGLTLPLAPTADGLVNLQGVGMKLDAAAASALNSAFSVTAFQAGSNVGTANAIAFVAP